MFRGWRRSRHCAWRGSRRRAARKRQCEDAANGAEHGSPVRLGSWSGGHSGHLQDFAQLHTPTKSAGSRAGGRLGGQRRFGPNVSDDVRQPDGDGVEPDDQGKMFIKSPRQRCVRSMHAPSVIGLRVWPTSLQAMAAYTFGGRLLRFPECWSKGGPGAREIPGRLLLRRSALPTLSRSSIEPMTCRAFEADLRNARPCLRIILPNTASKPLLWDADSSSNPSVAASGPQQ
jgi:hypothetical protein